MALTVKNTNKWGWHDQESHQHVRYGQRAQEVVGGIVKLAFDGHRHDHQYIPSNSEKYNGQDE